MFKKTDWTVWVAVIFVAALVSGGLYWQYGLWQECRSVHSFFYCWHILGSDK